MSELTVVEQLGKWVASKRFEDLSRRNSGFKRARS